MPSWCTTKGERCKTLNDECGFKSFWTRSTRPRSVTCQSGQLAVGAVPAALGGHCQEQAWASTWVPRVAHCTRNPREAPRTCPLASGWTRRRELTCHKKQTSHKHIKMVVSRRLAKRRRKAGLGKGGKAKKERGERAHSGGVQERTTAADCTWSGGPWSACRGRCIETLSLWHRKLKTVGQTPELILQSSVIVIVWKKLENIYYLYIFEK